MKLLNSLLSLLRRYKKTLLLILIVSTATILISSTISILLSRFYNLHLPSFGTVKTIGVEAYWDRNNENKTETIDWDTISIGTAKSVTLYIRSISNYAVTIILNATEWIPTKISDYMTLSWDYNGTSLHPGEIIQVKLTLSTSFSVSFIRYLVDNDVKSFSFEIYIGAYE